MSKQSTESENGHFGSAYSLDSAEETKTHYRSWAATYDQEVGQDNGYAQPARCAQALVDFGLSKDAKILDAGCGSGLSGIALQKSGYADVDGCDFSPEMLERAREKKCYAELWEADLNAGQPQIADCAYDAVTAVGIYSFGHLAPDSADDLLRIIKPGGLFVIALNEKYWDEGDLARKVEKLQSDGKVDLLSKEYGDHLPGHDVNGWVLVLKKTNNT